MVIYLILYLVLILTAALWFLFKRQIRKMKKKRYDFKCPYNNFGCTEIDTSGMIKISCFDCKHYKKKNK